MAYQTNDKNTIKVIRGTTKTLRVRITDAAGAPYILQDGDIVRFGVKRSADSSKYLIEKEVTGAADGAVIIILSPEDTAALDHGQYKYDVGLQSGENYFNVIPYSAFVILPNITAKE